MSVRYRTRSLSYKFFKSLLKKKPNKTKHALHWATVQFVSNHMNLSAIWNKQARVNLWSVQKLTSACLSQIALEQSCDYVLIIYMENTRLPIIIKHKQSACIKCKNNNLFKPCVRSKQSRTIKTIICSYIFTSLRRKKVLRPAKQFK